MDTLKKLTSSLPARLIAAVILASAGVIVADYYRNTSILLAALGFALILAGLLLIPGLSVRNKTQG
jgi:hypothetical protein